jgi:hypothetical protein
MDRAFLQTIQGLERLAPKALKALAPATTSLFIPLSNVCGLYHKVKSHKGATLW